MNLSGFEKDKLRKKFGHNHLTGSEMDYGRKLKEKKEKMAHKYVSPFHQGLQHELDEKRAKKLGQTLKEYKAK